ncbi:MAG: synthase gamma chain [Ignavibacteria bacterium]|nr:synthase gamma chain [Ignavibacteria bacterium]
MATLRDIKRRITAVQGTKKLTQAMKMIAAAKLRRAQDAIFAARPYSNKMEIMLSDLASSVGEDYANPLIKTPKEVKSVAVIVISSDRGMCGSFNTNLLRIALNYIRITFPEEFPGAQVSIIPVGRKACSFFRKEKLPVIKDYPGIFLKLKFTDAANIMDVVKKGFSDGKYDRVVVFYNEFVNLIKQLPSMKQLLPIVPTGKAKTQTTGFRTDYIFEPTQIEILDALLPKAINVKFWRMLLESNAAEQAARMIAMDNATTNATELIKNLDMIYNKTRQASITKEMLEIVGGADALKKG